MKTRSIFNLLLKVFGLFLFSNVLSSLPSIFASFAYTAQTEEMDYLSNVIITSGFGLLLIYLALAWFFTMKSSWISSKLVKEDEDTTLDISDRAIISIALIITGILLTINEIPNLIGQIENNLVHPAFNQQKLYLFVSLIKVGVGVCLVVYYRQITAKIISASNTPQE